MLTMTSFLLYGCGKGSQGGQSKAQKESKLVIAQISDAISLDPLINNEGPTNSINYNIYDGLIFQKADMTTEPALAEYWEQKGDLTWIFHLRKELNIYRNALRLLRRMYRLFLYIYRKILMERQTI